jgi:hypothetical protein
MAALTSGLPEAIGADEDLARFLTQSSHFKARQVQPSAFLPHKASRNTSVMRHGREPMHTLAALGHIVAGGRALYGAALIRGSHVRSAGLDVVPDEPPERHAVIVGWPWVDDDAEQQKAQQKEKALALASAAGQPLLF